MIFCEDVHFTYPSSGFSLKIEELSVSKREEVGLAGSSGSGKTTLLYLLAGILTLDDGHISVLGNELETMSDPERRAFRTQNIGFIFQQFELLDHLTVEDNIILPYFVHRELEVTKRVRDRVKDRAEASGIAHHLDRYPEQLSQGERQRVAVCRALITKPSLVLADEPTGNLDRDTAAETMEIIREQVRKQEGTLLFSSHDREHLSDMERIIEMDPFSSHLT